MTDGWHNDDMQAIAHGDRVLLSFSVAGTGELTFDEAISLKQWLETFIAVRAAAGNGDR